jgi:hypothetical protein
MSAAISGPRQAFLAAATTAHGVVVLPDVADRWQEPSALAQMTVGALTAHLARAVTNVDRYLQATPPPPSDPSVSAAEYFAPVTSDLGTALNAGVRTRADDEALVGHRAVAGTMLRTLERLRTRLPEEPEDRRVRVLDGAVMRLDDYLRTRLIELCTHTDDLCVSLGRPTPELPGIDVAIAALVEVAQLRHGELGVLRALARRERDPQAALRVL